MYKRFLGLLLAGTMMLPSTGFASNREFVKITIGDKPAVEVKEDKVAQWNSTRTCDVVIRVGEYEGKSGKRVYINNKQKKDLEETIVVREDSKGYYVSEFDINLKTATKLYNELKDNGVAVQLQVAKDKSEDLNAAGRKSNLSNPKLYISIHHNASDSKNAEGYYAITNEGDATGANIAGKLSNSIADNGLVKQRDNANNTGSYIGELNKIHNSTIPVLFELGFFTNPEELYDICSDEYTDYIANNMGAKIEEVLKLFWKQA
jgi:hypothetical protein